MEVISLFNKEEDK